MSRGQANTVVEHDLAERIATNLAITERAVHSLGDAAASLEHLPGPATARAALDVERRWRDLDSEFGLLDADRLGARAGSRSARSWVSHNRQSGRLIGILRRNRYLFPGFQIDETGQVRESVSQAVRVLRGQGWRDDHIILWFTAANGWLGGQRPVDRLDDIEAITTAATRSTDQW
jgi:hypothetical protein